MVRNPKTSFYLIIVSALSGLKEIIDTQNAYEQMVEDLSDKVNRLEDENIELGNAIRDLEEAGEVFFDDTFFIYYFKLNI